MATRECDFGMLWFFWVLYIVVFFVYGFRDVLIAGLLATDLVSPVLLKSPGFLGGNSILVASAYTARGGFLLACAWGIYKWRRWAQFPAGILAFTLVAEVIIYAAPASVWDMLLRAMSVTLFVFMFGWLLNPNVRLRFGRRGGDR